MASTLRFVTCFVDALGFRWKQQTDGCLCRTFKIVEVQRRSCAEYSHDTLHVYMTVEQIKRFVHTATLAAFHSPDYSLVTSGIKDNRLSGVLVRSTVSMR